MQIKFYYSLLLFKQGAVYVNGIYRKRCQKTWIEETMKDKIPSISNCFLIDKPQSFVGELQSFHRELLREFMLKLESHSEAHVKSIKIPRKK